MILTRIGTFGFFVALALAMFAWQANDLMAVLNDSPFPQAAAGVIGASLLVLGAVVLVNRKFKAANELTVFAFAGMWESVLAFGAIMVLSVGVPIGLGLIFMGGGFGLTAGWAGVKIQFFAVVDYFLVRSLLHFFASGASAFISLRYLRRRVMSILSVVGILLGVLVLIVVNSVMSGFQQDFREQIRGSLSHVLVRFDSQQIRSGIKRTEERKAEWAAYITAINEKKSLKSDWLDIEDRAIEEFRELQAEDKDGDRVADFLRAQPPIVGPDEQPVQPEETLTDAEKAFLDRVRSGEFLSISEAECLRDSKSLITPKAFYLERIDDRDERNKAEAKITQSWFWPLFRERMAHDFDIAEKSIKRHKNAQGEFDVIGVSPRVSTQTFITPRGGKTKELPIAQLIGVDVLSETKISNLGQYVAAAEIHSFREQYVLKPMRNMLGATLGWETKDSLDASGAEPAFLFLEEGKPLGRQRRMPADLSRDLQRRRLVTGVGKIRWAAFDKVEFWEFTPAQDVYDRVQEAY
ncbi:MAG: hypothetical protein L3J82_10710, partial [Planctomycetes bacterium]|nr:hypothetical protein [Planctomycetota bacterium]